MLRTGGWGGTIVQIIVLGMHRSGTSLLMQMLELLGCGLGPRDSFNPPDPGDPRGYFERRAVWALNEEMLASQHASWFHVAPFDLGRWDPAIREAFVARARAALADLEPHRPWAIKDPRLCLLFPVWREALSAPLCLLVFRRPLEVAQSLRSRDGFPIPCGIALWERYTLDALHHTRGLPRLLVSHRELLERPADGVRRLHGELQRLGVVGLDLPSSATLAAQVDRHAYRARAAADDERRYLNESQVALMANLEDGSALQRESSPGLSAEAGRTLECCGELQGRLRDCEERNRSEIAAIARCVDELDGVLEGVLDSKRWRLGRFVGDAWRRVSGRPPKPDPRDGLERMRRERRRRRPEGGASDR